MIVKKPDGSSRIVIDYRRLNAVTVMEKFTIPNIITSVEKMGGHALYSIIDSASAFHQVPLSEESRKYTAFEAESGHYEYLRMPM